jgi:ferredoxin--NADP+ reductase
LISEKNPKEKELEPKNSGNPLWVAVVGSGPAGFYAAEALAAANVPVNIDIIDRLPTPYGLVRAGVAPDHQSMKKVTMRYEKAALNKNVEFLGNICIGQDISLEELRQHYDAVILATGAPVDRTLGIPGDDKSGVFGSGEFVGWYNSHPDFADFDSELDVSSVAIIGNGNVAIDVARVLAKTPKEMEQSDLADYAAELIHSAPTRDIWMFGRRGPMEASFTPKELGEMGELEDCSAIATADQLPEEAYAKTEKELPTKTKIFNHLKSFSENQPGTRGKNLHFVFYARPVEILGGEHVEALRLEKTRLEEGKSVGTGETFEVPCQMVVSCIGYRSVPVPGAPFNEAWGLIPNEAGLVEKGLYVVGWIRRGPSGTIGTNRPDAQQVVAQILENEKPAGKKGRKALLALLEARGVTQITFESWKKIEAAEEAAAKGLAPRAKFAHIEDMLEIAK